MDRQPHVDRVTATPAALAALARLREQRGAVSGEETRGIKRRLLRFLPGNKFPCCKRRRLSSTFNHHSTYA